MLEHPVWLRHWLGENGEVGVACTEGGSSSGIEVESGRGACDMNGGDGDEYVELSTEELVEEAMRRVDFGGEVEFELMPGEMKEDLFVGQFMERGCGCVRKGGRACCEQFDVEHVKDSPTPTASPLPFTRHHMRGVDRTLCTTTRGSLFAM